MKEQWTTLLAGIMPASYVATVGVDLYAILQTIVVAAIAIMNAYYKHKKTAHPATYKKLANDLKTEKGINKALTNELATGNIGHAAQQINNLLTQTDNLRAENKDLTTAAATKRRDAEAFIDWAQRVTAETSDCDIIHEGETLAKHLRQ